MKKTYECKVEKREDYFVQLPDDLPYKEGQKFSVKQYEDGSFILNPYKEVELDLDDDLFLSLAKMAHEKDITLNDLVNEILKERIEREEQAKDFEDLEESSSEDENFDFSSYSSPITPSIGPFFKEEDD